MRPSFTLPAILNLLGAAQALLLAVALISIKRGNKTANRLLAAFAFMIAVLIGGSLLISAHYIELFPHLGRVSHPFDFLAGPLLYLYIRTLMTRRNLSRKDLLHFVPFVLCILYLIPYYLQSGEYKLNNSNSDQYTQWYFLRTALALLQAMVYIAYTVFTLAKFSRQLKIESSPAERAILFQARFLVISFLALLGVAILRYLFD